MFFLSTSQPRAADSSSTLKYERKKHADCFGIRIQLQLIRRLAAPRFPPGFAWVPRLPVSLGCAKRVWGEDALWPSERICFCLGRTKRDKCRLFSARCVDCAGRLLQTERAVSSPALDHETGAERCGQPGYFDDTQLFGKTHDETIFHHDETTFHHDEATLHHDETTFHQMKPRYAKNSFGGTTVHHDETAFHYDETTFHQMKPFFLMKIWLGCADAVFDQGDRLRPAQKPAETSKQGWWQWVGGMVASWGAGEG